MNPRRRFPRCALRMLVAAVVAAAAVGAVAPDEVAAVVRRLVSGCRVSVRERTAEIFSRRPDVAAAAAGAGGPVRILVFKRERIVEVEAPGWPKNRTYRMTGFSGRPGPKLREGDRQIPEGVYDCVGLNPNSAYCVSVKVGYPNAEERAHAAAEGRTAPGGNIFIHGGKASVGCIPVGDEAAEEIFCFAADCGVRPGGIVIAPYDMRGVREPEFERGIAAPPWYATMLDRLAATLDPI